MAFWSALRRWAERAISAGVLTIADIKSGTPRSVHAFSVRLQPPTESHRAK